MRFSRNTFLMACCALVLGLASPSSAGWVINDKLTAYPAITKEKFGCSVATDGNWLAVGATDTAIVGFRSTGAVHLFERVGDQWLFRQTLFHPAPFSFQAFGNAVALRQDHLVVGSWGSNGFAGRAFVYTRGGDGRWTLAATLEAADPQPAKPALFGWSVSLDMPSSGPGVIAVGRVNDTINSTGAIYVFEGRDGTWTQVSKLTASDATRSDQLGTSLSVRDGTLVAGVPRRRVAYIFTRSMVGDTPVWSQTAKLSAAASALGDNFGFSVASAGNFVAVGAPSRLGSAGESRAGAVVIFYSNGTIWQEGATITARSEISGDSFGYAVGAAPLPNSVQGIVVGSALSRDTPLANSGAAFAFRGSANSWKLDDTDLWTSAAVANQNIGKSLGISSDGSVVALATDGPTNSTGGAFPFVFDAASSSGSGATSGSSGGGSSGSGGSGSGGSGGGGSSGSGGSGDTGSAGGPGDDPADTFGAGGNVRPVNALSPLQNNIGMVSDTLVADNAVSQTITGLQLAHPETLNAELQASPLLLATYPGNLRLVAVADCNGDGGSDLLWQDRNTNEVVLWTRDGTTITKTKVVATPAAGVTAVAAYDVQGDGSADDILLLNPATSTLSVVNMYDGEAVNTVDLAMPGGGWRPVPYPFIANSVLIRNPGTGELRRITMPDTGVDSRTIEVGSPPASYEIQAIGDLDADGQPDLVARSAADDQVRFYLMNGNSISQVCTGIPTGHWNVTGLRDFDSNGVLDLLLSESGGDRRIVVLYMQVLSNIPQIKSNQVVGRLGMGGVVGLGTR
ncbi:MAG: FG-GAP-like repeat-containing protein [Planctomycetes bacterium]|nr:FG-GAP-like repeat-containing protein [Planctomycetota bacterium]